MSNLYSVLDKIKLIFDISDEKLSSLNALLCNIEKNRIYDKFDNSFQRISLSSTELVSKANLLNAVIEIILENPSIKEISDEDRKKVLLSLYETTSTLYEQLLKDNNVNLLEKVSNVAMYCMLSYMADKQTISNILIEDFNNELRTLQSKLTEMNTMEQLEFNTFYLIILMMSNIKNHDGLINLNSSICKAQMLLDKAQEEELAKEDFNIYIGLKISAFGNLIHLVKILKQYLFTGRIEFEKNQDIYGLIDIYSYNAFYLLGNEEIEFKVIGHLVKYAFTQVADNSIWSIAEKSPKIREFIEKSLSDGEKYIYSLLPSQRDVIADVLTPKKSIVVSMPTSSGKSLLAEMQILFCLHNYKTSNFNPTVCYVVPTNALIEQVKRDLKRDFKDFDLNVETVLPYYEIDEIEEEILLEKHIDILVCTPEKLESLVRQNHSSIQNTRLVIMDEAHNIGDLTRGSKFELLLATVKQNLKEASFLLLSPFISNADEIAEWLADSKRNSAVLSMEWAPTRQYVGCNILKKDKTESVLEFYKTARNQLYTENIEIPLRLNPHEVKRILNVNTIDNSVKQCVLINDLIDQNGNILVLCMGGGIAKKLASNIKDYFSNNGKLVDVSSKYEIKKALEIISLELGKDNLLYNCLRFGVCYHHAGLSSLVKETIEELIRENHIKILCATTTLAQGMNFPINTVIFDSLTFRGNNAREITNAEFWNIAGRAGRAYKDKEGYIIVSSLGSQKNTRATTKKFIKCELEEIMSSLNAFFKDNNQIILDYEALKSPDKTPILNLIQYINHILNISYDYNIDTSDMTKIRSILNESFLYHNLDKQEGYIKAQMKLNNFVSQYINHVKLKERKDLEKADELGISDISFSKAKSWINAFVMDLKEKGEEYQASKIILESRNIDKLSEIIKIIARIPELNIAMIGQGNFDPASIARLLIGWVNGEKVFDIAKDLRRENQDIESTMDLCNKYLNSQMKSYMPWGINIYQELSFDIKTEKAKLLPSFIYYGVSDKESVILSKVGVPRFAVENVRNVLKKGDENVQITVANVDELKKRIKKIRSEEYQVETASSDIIKSIIDERIDY